MIKLPINKRVMALALLIMVNIFAAPAQATTIANVQEWVRFALGLRSDHRATHGTWRHYNNLAKQKLDEGIGVQKVLVAVVADSHAKKEITHAQYQRLANLIGRIESTYEREVKARRVVNGRQASRSRKTINRKAVARVFGLGFLARKRIYTLEHARRALERDREYQATLTRREELDKVMSEVLEQGAGAAPCGDAEKDMLRKQVNAYNKKWADRWCTPHRYSGCGAPALDETNGLRASISAARNLAQCAWVQEMGGCKDRAIALKTARQPAE